MNRLASPAQLRASLLRWALFCIPAVMLLGYLSGVVSGSAANNPWFAALAKPGLYPPPIAFPIVWTMLYLLIGLALAWVPLVLIVMNVVYAAAAYPFGKMADSRSHKSLLAWGLLLLILADVALAWDGHWGVVWVGIVLWGLHMAMTQGLLAAMIADTAPADLRGTAYGFFNLASGLALLIASGLAGLLWDSLGAAFTFIAGAIISSVALALLLLRRSA